MEQVRRSTVSATRNFCVWVHCPPLMERALALTVEGGGRRQAVLERQRLEEETTKRQAAQEAARQAQLQELVEAGGRVVEFELQSGVKLRIVMQGLPCFRMHSCCAWSSCQTGKRDERT